MKPVRFRWKWIGVPAFLALFLTLFALAKDGRDFAGFYAVSNVTDLGEEVRVTLTVRVWNFSDADVTDATITLEDYALPNATYGSFTHVSIRDRESARLASDFTAPKREYERWENGGTPRMRVAYKDAAGKTVERMIELAPMLLDEEE